ncbi:alpha/beta hydrolase-fold protein [Hwangdonia lutea]|uniref:Alpha/beta hydrolase n=1 Tax=Hwangdonia lutea TaxID=3075823 RepID=A0AA97ERP3_9FLAO|nr:alpha/beta hydrolase-fold protein [Hwangdonia sp. SCSIO 19198]WOD45275.1 alpha/beta hydrolase [Hwangdonia sp. SCSIO 19198]
MHLTKIKFRVVLLFLMIGSSALIAQQRTGNIVEYFGKEKVNDIKEGKLLHVFTTGLALKFQNFRFNSSSFPKDQVFSRFLMQPNYEPETDDVFDIDFTGKQLLWKSIATDTTNSFNDRSLRSSYVYLSYQSDSEKTVLFEASGHSLVLINGLPHEGDHYDFGWNLIPLKLKKGLNKFVLKVGRFPRIRARLIDPQTSVQFTTRDLTLPDLLVEEDKTYLGAIRIINTSENWVENHTVTSKINGVSLSHQIPNIPPLSVQKVPFKIASVADSKQLGKADLKLSLHAKNGTLINTNTIQIEIKSKHNHHKRTLKSNVDGSVQYYSVAPSSDKNLKDGALFLSVHGASVEAVNQANAYKKKDWGNLIAPTNRRPIGFAWEDWGRLDALEVLADAKNIYKPNSKKIYLTGHSMGGHGTWYLGATYPDKFAAIAPCAGYPDLLLYRNGFTNRMLNMTEEQLKRFGISPKILERLTAERVPTAMENIIHRAGTPSRTLKLIRNYLHHGVYVLHGEIDNVVPTAIARDMRERLGKFHPDFTYYEYPDGTHWYGNHSVDWEPIFSFFKQRTIKEASDIKKYEFFTGSPGVSATSHFITIHQQDTPFETSSFKFSKEDGYKLHTDNVAVIEVDFSALKDDNSSIEIDGTSIKIQNDKSVFFKKVNDAWQITKAPSLKEKGPHRNGGFKDAFRNNVVFVYATNGTPKENEWYYNRARFDAETFWYRANGHIEMVKDVDFSLKKYADRNVVIYGNADNNLAWNKLLKDSPIQVKDYGVNFNGKLLFGNQWGMYFIVPRKDSDTASVGVVTATGSKGMKAAYMNHYLVNGTTFPDVLLFDDEVLLNGMPAVKSAGFFGNDWSVENGDFEWR